MDDNRFCEGSLEPPAGIPSDPVEAICAWLEHRALAADGEEAIMYYSIAAMIEAGAPWLSGKEK